MGRSSLDTTMRHGLDMGVDEMSSCNRCGASFQAKGNQRYCGPNCATQGATKQQQEDYYFGKTSRAIGWQELEDKVNNVLRRGERDL